MTHAAEAQHRLRSSGPIRGAPTGIVVAMLLIAMLTMPVGMWLISSISRVPTLLRLLLLLCGAGWECVAVYVLARWLRRMARP